MRFVDQCRVKVIAGDGGNGAVAFRREKYIPFGGPAGGDGGRGGDVALVGDEGMSTLLDFTHVRTLQAERGEHGQGSDCHGHGGKDRVERVPLGTQIRDHATGQLLADVTAHGQHVVVARGGKGGGGNLRFATPTDRAPRRAEKGEPGDVRELDLTLKVMADVGLIGFPNVGKSTFVAAVSAARPKIADYPFTTLVPMLGVVAIGGGARAGGSSFVIADIPGLIPGASEGVGLGIRFLQHLERTRALLHLVTLDPGEGRDPLADYRALRREQQAENPPQPQPPPVLEAYSPELAERPEVLALSKADLTDVKDAYPALRARFAKAGLRLRLVSAATREGLEDLLNALYRIARGDVRDEDRPPPLPAAKPVRKKAPPPPPVAKVEPAVKVKKKAVTGAKATAKKLTVTARTSMRKSRKPVKKPVGGDAVVPPVKKKRPVTKAKKKAAPAKAKAKPAKKAR
jgi:GTP-binding protein